MMINEFCDVYDAPGHLIELSAVEFRFLGRNIREFLIILQLASGHLVGIHC